MGNSIIKEKEKDFINIHNLIIEISDRLLLKYKQFLKDSICKKVFNESNIELNSINNEYIFKLFKKIYLPKMKDIKIKDNCIIFKSNEFKNIISFNKLQFGGNNSIFFKELPEFRKDFIEKIKLETKNKKLNEIKNESIYNEIKNESIYNETKNELNKNLKKIIKINKNLNKTINNLNKNLNNKNLNNKNLNNKNLNNKNLNNKNFSQYSFQINSNKKIQKINKKNVCELIIKHYMFRIKLISIILNLFDKNKKGYYNVCYKYFKNLINCKLCIPNIDVGNFKSINNINTDKLIKKIFKDVEKLSNKTNNCNKSNGLSISITQNKINEFLKKKDKYTKIYRNNLNELSKIYKKNIKKILKILTDIEENNLITNIELNKIAFQLSDIINDLNTNCKSYYLTAIVAFIHIKIKKDISNKKKL